MNREKPTPRRLTGGNPQIAKGEGDAPLQAYLDALPGWKQDIGRHIDALVRRAMPDVHTMVKWNTPFYGVQGNGWFLGHHCLTKYVKVAFLQGAGLRPEPPVSSNQPDVRYLHVHEGDTIDEEQFVDWVRQASALPGKPL